MSSISNNTDSPANQDHQLGENLNADFQFLRSFNSLTIPLPTPEGNESQLQGLMEAIKALARDVSSNIEYLGERIEVLEADPTANGQPLCPIIASHTRGANRRPATGGAYG